MIKRFRVNKYYGWIQTTPYTQVRPRIEFSNKDCLIYVWWLRLAFYLTH